MRYILNSLYQIRIPGKGFFRPEFGKGPLIARKMPGESINSVRGRVRVGVNQMRLRSKAAHLDKLIEEAVMDC
jgi:hypothetical protein